MRIKHVWIVAALLPLIALPANAQMMKRYFHISSGTGFFVNQQYVITNAHVVKECGEVTIKGAVPESTAAVRAIDRENDLALIESNRAPKQFAPLRFNIDDLKPGDRVLLLGYPGEAGLRGQFTFVTAQIENTQALAGMKGKFFISDVVEHGNSGGPVFDTSGNVIGVVMAKSVLYTTNAVTQEKLSEKRVGVAIDLSTLKQFLFSNGVFTEWLGSGLAYQDTIIEDNAKSYIVNVQCRTPANSADPPPQTAPQMIDLGNSPQ